VARFKRLSDNGFARERTVALKNPPARRLGCR
jgi:hypothetical protein